MAANPEKFVVGHGLYTSCQTAAPFDDSSEFRIAPTPIPFTSIIIHNILFIAFFTGFYFLCIRYGDPNSPLIPIASIGVGTMTCLLYTAFTYHCFAKENRLGPWLVLDKCTGKIDLPRHGMSFEPSEIVHFQYITTGRLDSKGKSDGDRVSELNLITYIDGETKRIPLLRSIFTRNAFEYITKPLLESTDLEVVRIQE